MNGALVTREIRELCGRPFHYMGGLQILKLKPNALHTALNFCSSRSSLHLLPYMFLTVSKATARSSRLESRKHSIYVSSQLMSA